MNAQQLLECEIIDLYDLMAEATNELIPLENDPKYYAEIKQKKEYILLLQNTIILKKLGN